MLDAIRWQILLVALAAWANRRQLEVIAYLREENTLHSSHRRFSSTIRSAVAALSVTFFASASATSSGERWTVCAGCTSWIVERRQIIRRFVDQLL
jgi:hypothetical protein